MLTPHALMLFAGRVEPHPSLSGIVTPLVAGERGLQQRQCLALRMEHDDSVLVGDCARALDVVLMDALADKAGDDTPSRATNGRGDRQRERSKVFEELISAVMGFLRVGEGK